MAYNNKALVSAQAFIKYNITDIVKYCKLSCNDYSWRIWFDDVGNVFKLEDDRTVTLIPAKVENLSGTTDVYFSSPIYILREKSIWNLVLLCKDECAIVVFLCKDNRLRIIQFRDGQAEKYQKPILYGIEFLDELVRVMDGKDRMIDGKEIKFKNLPYGFKFEKRCNLEMLKEMDGKVINQIKRDCA